MTGDAPITGIIFDCDGVLIDSEIISAHMLQAEALEWGVNLSLDYILDTYVGRSFPKVLADMQAQYSISLPAEFEDRYRTRLLEAFERDLNIIEGVKDTLAQLDLPYCVATSSSPIRVQRSLELVGLTDFFGEKVFTASQVANGKPAPDLFFFAAKAMGFNPAQTLVVEDSISGIKAGRAAGMPTIRFTGGSHLNGTKDCAGAHLAFDKFNQVGDYLLKSGQ